MQSMTILRILFLPVLTVILLSPSDLIAQERRSGAAVFATNSLRVDGVFDEAVWQATPAMGAFLQRDPHEGDPLSERTEVKIVYTSKSLFVAIRCFDAEPARVLATELRRDNDFVNDDSISILLDTLHDHRSGFLFRTNPFGTQYDALITDEGRITDVNWDENWTSVATIDSMGWNVEIEIPFKSLRLSGDADQVWGIDFERVIRRKSEYTYWSNYRRGFDFTKVSQAGELTGLKNLDSGMPLRIKPFLKTAVNRG